MFLFYYLKESIVWFTLYKHSLKHITFSYHRSDSAVFKFWFELKMKKDSLIEGVT